MPPTESQILTSFLLPPAPLPQIITLKRFTSLFPHALQSHPQIAHLYHELQHLRALDTDQVIENIAAEVRRGDRQRREVARARRRLTETGRDLGLGQGDENDGREIRMEMELFGPVTSHLPSHAPASNHQLPTLIPAMSSAISDLESEIASLETEASTLLASIEATVSGLSDLRYGRFNGPGAAGVGKEVLDGLRRLEGVCMEEGRDG